MHFTLTGYPLGARPWDVAVTKLPWNTTSRVPPQLLNQHALTNGFHMGPLLSTSKSALPCPAAGDHAHTWYGPRVWPITN